MKPAPSYPSAETVARAIVTAARAFGADPLAVAKGEYGPALNKARIVAVDALRAAFPDCPWIALGRMTGARFPRAMQAGLIGARKSGWWRETLADEVLGEIVAPLYGERAR